MVETLTSVVYRLVDTDIGLMTDAALRTEFLENRRETDRLEARNAVLLAALHRRALPAGDGATSTPAWVEHQTGRRWSEARASLDAGLACASLPLTAKAWVQGEISASAARAICQGRPEGHEDAYGEVEETLVEFAAGRSWRDLRAAIAHCRPARTPWTIVNRRIATVYSSRGAQTGGCCRVISMISRARR